MDLHFPSPAPARRPRLGGGLLLVGLTLLLSLLLSLAEVLPLYQQLWTDWASATAAGTVGSGRLTLVVSVEALGNGLLLLANLVLLALFLRRSRHFPRPFMVFCVLKPLFFLFYVLLAALLLPGGLVVEGENFRTLGHGLLYGFLCVVYMQQSEHVRRVFVR